MGFFEEMVDTAKNMADAAVQKTEELVDSSKIRLSVSKTQREIGFVQEKLGGAVYNMKKHGFQNEDLVASLCGELDALYEKLDTLNRQLAELSKQKICPNCGSKNKKESIFCGYCGADMLKEAQAKKTASSEPAAETVVAQEESVVAGEETVVTGEEAVVAGEEPAPPHDGPEQV